MDAIELRALLFAADIKITAYEIISGKPASVNQRSTFSYLSTVMRSVVTKACQLPYYHMVSVR